MKKNSKGVTATEYGLIGALISIVIMASVAMTGTDTKEVFCVIASTMETAMGGTGENCTGASNDSGGAKSGGTDMSNGGTIADLEASMTGMPLNMAYVDVSLGGTAKLLDEWNAGACPSCAEGVVNALKKINATDPVTNIFGLYDYATKEPLYDYDTIIQKLTETTEGVYSLGRNSHAGGNVEITTQSGKAYYLTAGGPTTTDPM